MRLLNTILASLALISTVLGAAATSNSSDPVQDAAIAAMKKVYPACALECMAEYIPKSYCPITNTKCICTNVDLNAQIGLCVAAGCSIPDGLMTKNVSMTACGAEVRDKRDIPYFIAIVGTAVATLIVLVRLYLVFTPGGKAVGLDDLFIVVSLACAYIPAVAGGYLKEAGLGKDMWTLKPEQITDLLFFYFLGEFGYLEAMGFIKISLLCFLLSIFPDKQFRMGVFVTMGLCAGYCITFFFTTLFQCTPISFAWTQWDGLHAGTCRDIHLLGWVSAAINIVLDVIVMALPIRQLLGLNMNWKKKLAVMSMFLVGGVVLIVSICRLQSLIQFSNSQNITWDYVAASYWSILEMDIGIICACMPAIRSLLLRAFPNMMSTGTKKSSAGAWSSQQSDRKPLSGSKGGKSLSQRGELDTRDFIPLVDREGKGARVNATEV